MATTTPETKSSTSPGWLDPFLATWTPGTGERHETREPATGRALLTLAHSTPDDVARAASTAAAAQSAWAETSYNERAAILRRAAEIYVTAAKSKLSVEEIERQIRENAYTDVPTGVMKFADFLHRAGTIPAKPSSWKEVFFDTVHQLPGN